MSKVSALFHIVFCTKHRAMTIPLAYMDDMYRFIWKELQDQNCVLFRIGGIQNHIHMLIDLNPGVSLSQLMQKIKSNTSGWMKRDGRFPAFIGWAAEYFAVSISPEHRFGVIEYIRNQKEHHLRVSPDDEFETLFRMAGQTYHEQDLQ